MSDHGTPCWYELASKDPAAVQRFYAEALGWSWRDAGMQGMSYLLGARDGAMIAGLHTADDAHPAGWQIYISVEDADATVKEALALGAKVLQPAADIPGTGRFGVLSDPQGARFGILQPLPMQNPGTPAFAPDKLGHGQWQDLITSDTKAALPFYGSLFGWTVARSMAMGPDASYHILSHRGTDIGGTFTSQTAPYWKPYFGVASTKAAAAQVKANGGQVLHGPDPVPGGQFTLQITDPTGTILGLVGAA